MADKDTSPEAAGDELLKVLLGETEEAATDETADEEQTDDADEEQPDEGDDSAEDDSDEEEDSAEEESDEEDSAQDAKAPKVVPESAVVFTVETDGKNETVTAGEAKAGYMRTADYTRKTQDVAAERTAIQAERSQLDEALKNILALMSGEDAESTPTKLAELARTDPEAATRLRFDREARAEQRQRVDAARKELADRTNTEQVEDAKKGQAVELASLLKAMPDLREPSKAKAILSRLTRAAVAVGFVEADMNRIGDHRLMRLLDLAEIGLRLSAKKAPTPEPKGTKVPAITPGVRARSTTGKDQAARDARFKHTRDPEDAADSLMAAMEAVSRKSRR